MSSLVRWLLAMCAVPILSLALSHYSLQQSTDEIQQALLAEIDGESPPDADALREEVQGFDYAEFALSQCGSFGLTAEPEGLSEECCWYALQPIWARRISVALLALALALAIVVGSALAIAARGPAHLLRGMRLGWSALRVFAIPHVVGQGALAVFLAFWVTAVFAEFYSIRLISIVAGIAVAGIAASFKALARRPSYKPTIHGALLERAEAQAFFSRLDQIASEVPTAPPDNVVLGIDDNFFVTEVPMVVSEHMGEQTQHGTEVRGRTLFASVALMDVLEVGESEAILAHELGHLAAGDTQRSAGLTPMLERCAAYVDAVEGSFTFGMGIAFSWYVDAMRRVLGQSSRAAELDADATAARIVDADNLARALIKVTAYSSYRSQQEDALINAMKEHDELAIAARVRDGFAALIADDEFRTSITGDAMPHPYDSHPPLLDRLDALGVGFPAGRAAEAIVQRPTATLTERIASAQAIAKRLWDHYHERFADVHRELIALRLQPSTPEEVEQVERGYPARSFTSNDGVTEYRIDWRGLTIDRRTIAFEKLLELFQDGDKLTIAIEGEVYPEIKLATLRPHAGEFVDTLSRYLHRHRCARGED